MSRFQSLVRKTTRFDQLQPVIGLDIGSARTKVIVDSKVVWHQPTAVARHTETQSVVAIGDKAYHLAGKTPQSMQLVFPVRDGVIADSAMMVAYLELMMRALQKTGIFTSFLQPRCWVAVPAGASPVERAFFKRCLQQAGLSVGALVPKPVATAKTLQPSATQVLGVIDVGAQTIEVGLFAGGEQIVVDTIHTIGTERWISAIQQLLKATHSCEIGWETAEKVLTEVGYVAAQPLAMAPMTVIRGRDTRTSTVMTLKVSGEEFRELLLDFVQEIGSELQLVLSTVVGDVVTQALSNGMVLCGGGSQLRGLATLLAESLGGEMVTAPNPELTVVTGVLK